MPHRAKRCGNRRESAQRSVSREGDAVAARVQVRELSVGANFRKRPRWDHGFEDNESRAMVHYSFIAHRQRVLAGPVHSRSDYGRRV